MFSIQNPPMVKQCNASTAFHANVIPKNNPARKEEKKMVEEKKNKKLYLKFRDDG